MSGQIPEKTKAQTRIYRLLSRWLSESVLRWLSTCFAPEPIYPLSVELTAIEKAKMDYDHGLKVKQIRWDKGVFALVLAVVGALGIYWGNRNLDDRRTATMKKMEEERAESTRKLEEEKVENAKVMEKSKQDESRKLEEFRTREAGRRSLLEKQLPELFAINEAMSKATAVYFFHVGEKKPGNESEIKKEYEAALKKAAQVINRSPFLFDVEFNKDLDWYHAVHANMNRLPIEKWERYREFAEELSNQFDHLCRSVIEGQRDDPQKRFRMPLKEMKPEERRKLSPEKRVEEYYQHWLAQQGNKAAKP